MHYVSEALEQQLAALAALVESYEKPWTRPGVTHQERAQWYTDIAALQRARSYFWNDRTVELTASTLDAFNLEEITATRNLVEADAAFCWFSNKVPFEVEAYDPKGRMLPVRAISWYWFGYRLKPFLGITAWAQTDILRTTGLFTGPVRPVLWACTDEQMPLSTQIQGERLNFQGFTDERTIREIDLLKKFVVAANTFMRQDILRAEKTEVERHLRKRLAKVNREHDLRVVQLRRLECKKPEAHEPRPVDWANRWWVGSHTRKQWYPSLQEHLPVIIFPYIKGPEDKPLKPRTTPIYSVTR